MVMRKGRLEAFSDGVIAIIITIMVLELKLPHGGQLSDLRPLLPVFISYMLSFINVGLYWNNHHHLFRAAEQVNGKVLWANLHLLFWLSLLPFATAWTGENNFSRWTVIFYTAILFMSGCAYYILVQTLLRLHKKDSALARAIGKDAKGKISMVLYVTGIAGAFFIAPYIALLCNLAVAAIWFVPDKRIEKNNPAESEDDK